MMEQRSQEWFVARLGKVTASRVSDVMAKTKSGYSTSRANYMAELICERLTGQQAERFTNAAMQWGVDNEHAARDLYCFMQDAVVDSAGFDAHHSIADFGASPDGYVGTDGLLEIKCPNTATHIETLLNESIDGKYLTQMQVQMACTGRKWCDFASFDPRLPVDMQLYIKRVERDDARIVEIETEVAAFLRELRDKVARIKAKYDTSSPKHFDASTEITL
jgi:putative phage-type endonuclease